MHRPAVFVIALVALAAALPGQWLDYKTPGIPRTKDGRANLSAPAPRLANGKPDFSGLWRDDPDAAAASGAAMDAIKAKPWSVTLAKQRKENLFRDATGTLCLPPGPLIDFGVGKIVQTANTLLMLYDGTLYREVFLDGRSLEKGPNPSWMGYSTGRWEGDTLVVESNGYNDRTWLDEDGHSHTEALRVTERIRRPDFGHLEVTKTLTDDGALEEPWTVPLKYVFDADNEQLEYVCNENERDREHLVGKLSDQRSTTVPRDVLSQYTGRYEFNPPARGDITMTLEVVLESNPEGDELVFKGLGAKQSLTPLSSTQFATVDGTTIDFFKDERGAVTHMIAHIVEGDIKATRTK